MKQTHFFKRNLLISEFYSVPFTRKWFMWGMIKVRISEMHTTSQNWPRRPYYLLTGIDHEVNAAKHAVTYVTRGPVKYANLIKSKVWYRNRKCLADERTCLRCQAVEGKCRRVPGGGGGRGVLDRLPWRDHSGQPVAGARLSAAYRPHIDDGSFWTSCFSQTAFVIRQAFGGTNVSSKELQTILHFSLLQKQIRTFRVLITSIMVLNWNLQRLDTNGDTPEVSWTDNGNTIWGGTKLPGSNLNANVCYIIIVLKLKICFGDPCLPFKNCGS